MAAVAPLCDHSGCKHPASSFGFVQGQKAKVCQDHLATLTSAKVSIFDMTAFEFIETSADISLFEQVNGMSARGLEHLAVLESRCESDWDSAVNKLKAAEEDIIEVARRSFKEMLARTHLRYEEAKKELKQRRASLERITKDKHFRLSPADSALCESLPTGSLFHVVFGECQLAIAETLLASCHLLPTVGVTHIEPARRRGSIRSMVTFAQEQAESGKADVAEEVCEFVEGLGGTLCPDYKPEALKKREQLTHQLMLLLPDAVSEQDLHSVTEKYIAEGRDAREAGDYVRAMHKLERCKGLLQQRNEESAELCLELGLVLSHFGQMTDAEVFLRRGLELSPPSELALQLCTAMAGTFFQTGRWEETETICEEALQKWGSQPHTLELLKVLYYLVNSHFLQDQVERGLALTNEWVERIAADTPKSKCALLFIRAEKLRVEGSQEAHPYEEALELGQQVLPNSYLTVCARRRLGILYKAQHQLEKAEDQWLRACETHAIHFPRSLGHAICLSHLGHLRKQMKKLESAEEMYLQACQIYSAHFPHTLNFAICLNNLALLYEAIKGIEQAEEQYLKACKIYASNFPQVLDFAICLANLGDLYKSVKRFDKAEERYLQAYPVFLAHPTGLSFAHCLFSMGLMYEATGRKEEAAARLEQALKIYVEKEAHADATRCESALKHLNR